MRARVLITMAVAVTLGALGDVALSCGMKGWALSPMLLVGIALQLAFLLLYLACLSWDDLSYVLPLAAADYVLVTVFAALLTSEHVSADRWLGSLLVSVGVALVARSRP